MVTTIALYGVLRLPDLYGRLHAIGMASGAGVVLILLASIGTANAAVITSAVLVMAFLLLTSPISSHAMAHAAYRSAARHETDERTKDAKR